MAEGLTVGDDLTVQSSSNNIVLSDSVNVTGMASMQASGGIAGLSQMTLSASQLSLSAIDFVEFSSTSAQAITGDVTSLHVFEYSRDA